MQQPKVYADFQNADPAGRVRLNCVGTVEDLARHQIVLREGLKLILYADDADSAGRPGELVGDGTVTYSDDEHCWVATLDWSAIRHVPAEPSVNGSAPTSAAGARSPQ